MSPSVGYAGAALATPQEMPAHLGFQPVRAAVRLPFRSAEPWTVEQWFAIVNNQGMWDTYFDSPQVYLTTPSKASGGLREGFAPRMAFQKNFPDADSVFRLLVIEGYA